MARVRDYEIEYLRQQQNIHGVYFNLARDIAVEYMEQERSLRAELHEKLRERREEHRIDMHRSATMREIRGAERRALALTLLRLRGRDRHSQADQARYLAHLDARMEQDRKSMLAIAHNEYRRDVIDQAGWVKECARMERDVAQQAREAARVL
ncbi:MAG: hypothetical protein C3L25_06145 [Candidatus Sedimenticola endophacoides]|nr:MAG: hypothetical protein C3L26_06090 [Candidatus Sedimenticola endophacoides]PUE00363.1 MAG: hypothetical protein C3L26_06095 [Candidatus Sedimenticola endophacoides]PUE00364.1 MAG: hypothetical protein C3L26_06100 [Candidatus Sedimenticola endophacoides]PUE00365.1 MAG: hypothetical protein C3L26_06105 [Candidatus Sedimenticola endophacoides]PUE00366.1 MAG: hypothetical protein C3L26_06110 [Candidatus Sedimenticola endophacoides]